MVIIQSEKWGKPIPMLEMEGRIFFGRAGRRERTKIEREITKCF